MVRRAVTILPSLALMAGAIAPLVRGEPGSAFSDDPVWLVRDGVFSGEIFVSPLAPASEREAAEYLATWIGRVSGVKPNVVPEGSFGKAPGVYVGSTIGARNAGVAAPHIVSGDAFVFEARPGRRLFIVGDSPQATRSGVARFIEETLGVAFLAPGEFGADWKPLRRVILPEGRREFIPAFAWRSLGGLGSPEERIWAADRGLGALPPMNHALHSIFDAKAFAENPSMFPFLGGKITGPSGRDGYEPQPNLANPDSAKHAAVRAIEFFKSNPASPAFSLSINDNMTWDESPASKAAMSPAKYFRNRPDYSDYVFGFMNRTARALEETEKEKETRFANGKFLTGYAYYHAENTPSFRLDAKVFPVLTADRSEWRDPAFAAEDAALITRWSKSGVNRFGIYDYYYGLNMAAPRIFLRAEADSIRHAAKQGASLFYAELDPDWGFDGAKAWLATRLLWNPGSDPDRLLRDYYDRAYGPAAGAMRRFFTIAESRWNQRDQPPRWIRFFREESVAELFPADVRDAMRDALDVADRSFARDEPFLPEDGGRASRRHMRVRTTRASFDKFDAFASWYEAKRRLAALPPASDAEGSDRIQTALTDCDRALARYVAAVGVWNSGGLNPGAPYSPAIFWNFDPRSAAASKLGATYAGLPLSASAGGIDRGLAAALAANPPAGVGVLFNESFEADAFRPANPESWAGRHRLTIPKSPWRVNLFEAEHTRFGYSGERAASGKGSLLIAGGDLARVSRTVPVFAGDTLGVRLLYSGKILPGVHVGLSIRFMDAAGREASPGAAGVAMPGEDTGWRSLALGCRVPEKAVAAEISLRVMNQGPDDALRIDDFSARECPPGEPWE